MSKCTYAASAANLCTNAHGVPEFECAYDLTQLFTHAEQHNIPTKPHSEQQTWLDTQNLWSGYKTPVRLWLHCQGGLPLKPKDTDFNDLGHADDVGLNLCVYNALMCMGLTAHAREYTRQVNKNMKWDVTPQGDKFRLQYTVTKVPTRSAKRKAPVSDSGDTPVTKAATKAVAM